MNPISRCPNGAAGATARFSAVLAVVGLIASASIMVSAMLSGPAQAVEPDAPQQLISYDETIGIEIEQRLARDTRSGGDADRADVRALRKFYKARGNSPLWVSARGLNNRAVAVMAEIRRAGDWALPASAFKLPDIAVAADGGPRLSARLLAEAEKTLSVALLKYARFARGGRIDPAKTSSFLDRKLPLVPPGKFMTEISASAEPVAVLRDLHPTHPQFKALLRAYHALTGRSTADEESDQVRIPNGPTLKQGMTHSQVAMLRERLGMPAVDPWQRNMFDQSVEAAVRKFQKANGLTVDGFVGGGTRAALNGGEVKGDPKKLLANIEQWRWMPHDMGQMHVLVNIPEFRIRVYNKGKVVHKERVVVGKTVNQTPIFSENMKWIEFHPKWYVPESIKVREIGPNIRSRGQSFLKGMNLDVKCPGGSYYAKPKKKNFWDTPEPVRRVDLRNCQVVQGPGPKNVLGVVKFKFPNKHSVYLHDTTSKSLFNRRVRAYSHGCVRVRNPLKLAEVILRQDQGMSRSRIDNIVNGPVATQQTYLKTRIPVHVTYFTAFADKNGRVHYFKDIYGHEKRIALAMKGRYDEITPVPVAKGPTRVARRAPVKKKAPNNLFQAIFGDF